MFEKRDANEYPAGEPPAKKQLISVTDAAEWSKKVLEDGPKKRDHQFRTFTIMLLLTPEYPKSHVNSVNSGKVKVPPQLTSQSQAEFIEQLRRQVRLPSSEKLPSFKEAQAIIEDYASLQKDVSGLNSQAGNKVSNIG
jgi:hypothetical protein